MIPEFLSEESKNPPPKNTHSMITRNKQVYEVEHSPVKVFSISFIFNFSQKVITYPNEKAIDAVSINEEDIARLLPENFLNDNIIDFWLR